MICFEQILTLKSPEKKYSFKLPNLFQIITFSFVFCTVLVVCLILISESLVYLILTQEWHGGSVVGSVICVQKVAGSTSTLAAT